MTPIAITTTTTADHFRTPQGVKVLITRTVRSIYEAPFEAMEYLSIKPLAGFPGLEQPVMIHREPLSDGQEIYNTREDYRERAIRHFGQPVKTETLYATEMMS